MSMVVAHNLAAINANKNLYGTNRNLNNSLAKLSSGYRINVGADAPADLVISEQLRAQSAGLERAVRNTTEAINVLSIAEGALNEMNSILKKMKALAIHAANNGITSPEQVAADQAEMDSGIQTLERIAMTTKYSDQFLLNGGKNITYAVDTDVKGTQNNQLLDTSLTTFNQIFKRDGYQVSIGFNGATGVDPATNIGTASMPKQAQKAYLEVDAYNGTLSQVDQFGNLTQGQSFILTGKLGSRQFTFSEGAHVSKIVSAIHNVAGSTGVDAALIFNRNQQINVANQTNNGNYFGVGKADITNVNQATIYDNYTGNEGNYRTIAHNVEFTGDIVYGKNTDGNGDIYVKIIDNNGGYEVYKDSSLSKESLIGSGNSPAGGPATSNQRNNSGLNVDVTLTGAQRFGDVIRISTGNIALTNDNIQVPGTGGNSFINTAGADPEMIGSSASGVALGINTSSDGKLYFKVVYGNNPGSGTIYAYKDPLMRDQDMVAKTYDEVDLTSAGAVVLDAIWNKEHTKSTGLGITLSIQNTAAAGGKANTTESFDFQFSNMAARIYSNGYGSDEFITVQQLEGGLFVDYEDPGNYDTGRLIEGGDTYTKKGQDATITVNGQQMYTTGLELNLATPDIQAKLTFNSGKTGTTTIAQVGYGESTIFNKATSLTLTYSIDPATGQAIADTRSNHLNNVNYTAMLNNACHNTNERVSDFQGGMQLQLGEGAGDQNRTVIGIKSLSTTALGRIKLTQQFDKSRAVIETKTLSIQDVMGGQIADLKSNPNIAMSIIEQAISDVSEVRAQIGAVQSNMLQTNENNLRVAIENITKTESAIRDTDMASEMTEFTKNQILSNAGVNMLSQANAQAQNVLQLLQ